MIVRPIARPYPMDMLPATFDGWEMPSLRAMLDRAMVLQGTNLFRQAVEAMMIRAVLEQAINLSNIANYARQDPWDASELAFTGTSGTHASLQHLHREVAFRTMDMWKQSEREERLAQARKRRAEKKAAEPPKKKRKASSVNCQPLPETRTASTVQPS
ncbi:hypothetical protein [Comamonas koreensis]|uniref:Uncharacterized protein n=1 Tax=Comamonas koreensis TaxID=160825 RepID=A0AAW4XWH7_9BURK|nr:hypothetical protein [Comamonas koreensis]MCD2165571.1 hypothetical protein [Comamonas koreensis]